MGKKYIVFWNNKHNGLTCARILSKTKDNVRETFCYLAEEGCDKYAIDSDDVVFIGGYNDIPYGLFQLIRHFASETYKLSERISILEKENTAITAALHAVKSLLSEEKHNGKSKTHNCKCSGQCSGNCKQGR